MSTPNNDFKTNKKEKVFEVLISEDLCKGCGICVDFCPAKVFEELDRINRRGYYQPHIKSEVRCTGCKLCELLCPEIAIFITDERP